MSTSSRLVRRVSMVSGIAISAGALIGPATATTPFPVYVDARPPTSQTITYGDYWGLTYRSEQDLQLWQPTNYQVEGLPGGDGAFTFNPFRGQGIREFYLQVSPNTNLLEVGEYQVGVSFSGTYGPNFVGITRIPHSLVVEPAELVTDVRVAPDRADPQNTVVSMRLTGTWIENLYGYYRSSEGRERLDEITAPPAGRWSMTIRDAAGEALVDRQFDLDRGDVPAVAFLWGDAPIAEAVTVEATFAPAPEEAGNFSIVAAAPIGFTTGQESRPAVSVPVVADSPVTTAPEEGGVTLPLWALAALAIAGVGTAGAAVTVAAHGRRRAGGATLDESAAVPVDETPIEEPDDRIADAESDEVEQDTAAPEVPETTEEPQSTEETRA